ncbi:MAG: hypothetical protein ACFE8M_10560 [Candidatus Hermodarchaeota archaeon]
MKSIIAPTPTKAIPIIIKGKLFIKNPIKQRMPPIPTKISPTFNKKLKFFCRLCFFSSFVSTVNSVDFEDLFFVDGGISLNFVPHERQKS